MARKISEDKELRRRVIQETSKTQAEAAERAGISQQAWSRWAASRELAPRRARPPVLSQEEKERRLSILRSSSSVQEAAKKIGVSPPALYPLMREAKLNPLAEERARRNQEWIALMRQGRSDAAIAREYGVEKTAVRHVRRKAGLPAIGSSPPKKTR